MHGLLEGNFFQTDGAVGVEVLAENVGGESDCAAGVLFLGEPEEIGGKADLRFHFLFAVAVIIVREDGDHHAAMIAGADFEGRAFVVEIFRIAPAHAVAALALGGLIEMRQAERGFLHADKMRRENHAAGVAGPVGDVESGVVFGQMRIAAIAEDRFDEIEIADEAAGREEARLHRSWPGRFPWPGRPAGAAAVKRRGARATHGAR